MTPKLCVPVAMLAFAIGIPGAPATGEGQPSPRPIPAGNEDERITPHKAREVADEIIREIEELRGLSFKKSVPVKVIDDEQAREYMLQRLERFEMKSQMEVTGEAYRLLGLLPGKVDLVETVLDIMREQAGGFYDPDGEVFYVLSDMPFAMLSMITAHELTHALEDQHFDLDSRLKERMDNDDRLFAASAVHEGSAMVLMSLFSARRLVSGILDPSELTQQAQALEEQEKALTGMPPVLLRQLLGPYILGAGFLSRGNLLQTMMVGFPTADVDRAYAAGPLSSEQILHPEKYWDPDHRDDPQDVVIGGAAKVFGPRWRRVADGVLGELVLGSMVGAETPQADAMMMMRTAASWTNRAAAGWGGDRWELWKRGGSAVIVAAIEWDTERDVQEFVDALPEGSGLALDHRGTRLALVAGKAGKKRSALLAALLDEGDARSEGIVPPRGNR